MEKLIFKGDLLWRNKKYEIQVFDDADYDKLKDIAQVYGFVFNKKDEILVVKLKGNDWCLPGGGPEKFDKDWRETLIREVEEEANVLIDDIFPACYLVSISKDDNPNGKTGTMLRAIAKVKKIKKRAIDPATGNINLRKFISINQFSKYCKWGDNGKVQLELALKAKKLIDNQDAIEINNETYLLADSNNNRIILINKDGKAIEEYNFGKKKISCFCEIDGADAIEIFGGK